MQLQSVSITGFRSIERIDDLRIGSPTLLTGHNDAGKSAALDALRFLLGAYQLSERDPTYVSSSGGDASETADIARVDRVEVTGTFSVSPAEQSDLGLPPTARIRRLAENGGSAIYELETAIPNDPLLCDLDAQLAPELKSRVASLGLSATSNNKPDLLAALKSAAQSAPSTPGWVQASSDLIKALPAILSFNPSGVADAEEAIRTALQTAYKVHEKDEQFRGTIRKLEKDLEVKVAEDAAELRDHIMKTVPDIGTVTIIPSISLTSGFKNTQISVTNAANEAVHLGEAGAGRARRVSLAVWEYNTGLLSGTGDFVILYDEPDTHLDYNHQRNFMKLIRRQTDLANVRMAIATHSMSLIDGIDIADVVLLKHDERFRTTANVLADDTEIGNHLGAVAASLGLRNTVLLHERLFVGVEGATEAAAFPVLFRLSTGRQLEACGIAMWSCDNNEGALKFAAFLNSHGRDVTFVVDQDSKKNSSHLFSTKKLAQYGLSDSKHAIYLGHPNELEDIFEDETWVRVANLRWPRTDGAAWQETDVASLRAGKFSSDLLELMKSNSETGPKNKQELMATLVLELTEPDEVPESLSEAFKLLVDRAS